MIVMMITPTIDVIVSAVPNRAAGYKGGPP